MIEFTKLSQFKTKYLPDGSLALRFIGGAAWSLIGNVVSRGLSLLTSVVIARFIGKVGFGEFGIVQSTVLMLGTFAGLGIGITATKYIAEYRNSDPTRAGKILSLSLLVATLSGSTLSLMLLYFAPELATISLAAPHLTPLLRLAAVLLLSETINGALTGSLAGFESFRVIARVNFIAALVTLPVAIIGTWLTGLQGAVFGLIAFSLSNCLLNFCALRTICVSNRIILSISGCLEEWKVLWHYSIPSFLSCVMVGPVTWLCNSMLVKQTNGYAEMGIFNAANQWRNLLLMLPSIFSSIALPMLSSFSTDESNNFSKIIDLNQRVSILATVPLVTFLMFLGDLILRMYGKDFSEGYPVIVAILSGMAISSIGSAAGAAIQAQGRMWLGALMNFTWGTVYLVFVFFTVSLLGARSLAYGFALAHLVLLLWGYVYLYRDLPYGMFSRTILTVSLILLLSVAAIEFSTPLRYFMLVPALTLVCIFLYKMVFRLVPQVKRESC